MKSLLESFSGDEWLTHPIPEDACPDCTKDLEDDGWCFECRCYPRGKRDV